MPATRVEVHLFKDDDNGTREVFEERIRVRVFSNVKKGMIMYKDVPYVDACAYSGGSVRMVEDLGGYIAESMNLHPKYKDNHDPELVAQAAVKAFKEALIKAELKGFGRYLETSDDEEEVVVKATGGASET